MACFVFFQSKWWKRNWSASTLWIQILIAPLKFDGTLDWQGIREEGVWLREADNNRLYGVGHKNWRDKRALRKSWRNKSRQKMKDLQECKKSPWIRLALTYYWQITKSQNYDSIQRWGTHEEILFTRWGDGVSHIDTSLGAGMVLYHLTIYMYGVHNNNGRIRLFVSNQSAQ